MKAKTYYHNVANSRYIKADGEELIFVGGQLTTEDAVVQADLDSQIARGTSVLRRQQEVASSVEEVASSVPASVLAEEVTPPALTGIALKIALAKEAKEAAAAVAAIAAAEIAAEVTSAVASVEATQ